MVTTGVGQPDTTIAAAKAHPDTTFIASSQDMTAGPASAMGLIVRDDEGYRLGALEAVASSSGAGTSLFCLGVDVDQFQTVPRARPCLLSSTE